MSKDRCVLSGATKNNMAPANVLDVYRVVPAQMKNVEVHVLPGVRHGYTMHSNTNAFNKNVYDFSMQRALPILGSRSPGRR